jgi:hypothetical protein
MRVIEKTLYHFDELSDDAKKKARAWWRDGAFDYDWWGMVYEDAERIANIIGIELNHKHGKEPTIYFSGFWSQGDGACFEGRYTYSKRANRKIRAYATVDKELHRIADDLMEIQKRYGYQLYADMKHAGHYSHSGSMRVDVCDEKDRLTDEDREAVTRLMRDFANWIYKTLEAEYDYLNADEQVDETIRINEYEFDEKGVKT